MGLSNELFLVLINWTWEGCRHTHNLHTLTHIPINRNRPGPISPTHFEENDKISIVISQCSSCLHLLFPPTVTSPTWEGRSSRLWRTVHSTQDSCSRVYFVLPAHDLVGQQDPAHLWVFILALIDNRLKDESRKRFCSKLKELWFLFFVFFYVICRQQKCEPRCRGK